MASRSVPTDPRDGALLGLPRRPDDDGALGGGFAQRVDVMVGRRKAALGVVVVVQRQPDLLEVVAAAHLVGPLARVLHGGEQQGGQDADDEQDDEHFDERVGSAAKRGRHRGGPPGGGCDPFIEAVGMPAVRISEYRGEGQSQTELGWCSSWRAALRNDRLPLPSRTVESCKPMKGRRSYKAKRQK